MRSSHLKKKKKKKKSAAAAVVSTLRVLVKRPKIPLDNRVLDPPRRANVFHAVGNLRRAFQRAELTR